MTAEEINKKRLEQFDTMTEEELEIYNMNLKDDDPYIRYLGKLDSGMKVFGDQKALDFALENQKKIL